MYRKCMPLQLMPKDSVPNKLVLEDWEIMWHTGNVLFPTNYFLWDNYRRQFHREKWLAIFTNYMEGLKGDCIFCVQTQMSFVTFLFISINYFIFKPFLFKMTCMQHILILLSTPPSKRKGHLKFLIEIYCCKNFLRYIHIWK